MSKIKTEVISMELNKKCCPSKLLSAVIKFDGVEKKVYFKYEYGCLRLFENATRDMIKESTLDLDFEDIDYKFKELIKEEENEQLRLRLKKRESAYDNNKLHEFKRKLEESSDKEIIESDIIISSKEDFLKSDYNVVKLFVKQKYKKLDDYDISIQIKTNFKGQFILFDGGYATKKSKYFQYVYPELIRLIRRKKEDIDYITDKEEKRKRKINVVKIGLEEYGKEILERYRTDLVWKRTNKNNTGVGIQFSIPDDDKLVKDVKITGKFTIKQLKQLIEIVKDSKVADCYF